jgi:hypothetical protein
MSAAFSVAISCLLFSVVQFSWRPLYGCLLPGLALLQLLAPAALAAPPVQQGIALGLFAEDASFSYEPLLREIARTGANYVSIIVPYYQHDLHSERIMAHPRFSPSDEVVLRTLRQARQARLQVLLFPILRLEYTVTVDEWRGAIAPRDVDAWWRSYRAFILKFARLAAQEKAAVFCVGSELSSLDTHPERWAPLVREVRRIFRGELVYSANWDHYGRVGLWHLVDLVGLSAYFPLTEGLKQPSLERLIHAWREQRVQISRFRARINKPLVFTELGYHSQDRTNAFPWDESANKPINQKEQADCYEAFIRVWQDVSYLRGVYFWNWFGWGGPQSREYCTRGKPATSRICRWFGATEQACPQDYGMPWFDSSR